MKDIIKKYLLLIGFALSTVGYSQTYNMNNTNVTTCSGTFYDSGGNGGNYSASETYTKTFCPTPKSISGNIVHSLMPRLYPQRPSKFRETP